MRKLRRSISVAVLAIATIAGVLAFAPGTASAAGPWFVATTGNNANTCLDALHPCATIAGTLAKGGFVSGDTINIAPGTYTERPLFTTKSAKLVGAGSASTIFNGQLAGPSMALVFGIAGTLPVTTPFSLSGVTLKNGKNTNGLGGGFASVGGVITMNDVVITASQAVDGAGIYGASSVYTINNSTITGNAASGVIASGTGAGGAFGGGIAIIGGGLTSTGGLVVSSNTVTGSVTAAVGANPNGGAGGGIALVSGVLDLTGAQITGNTATKGYGSGGGIYVNAGTTATVSGGSISSNIASAPDVILDGAGGGAFVAGKAGAVAAGNLKITGTTLDSNAVSGGAQAAGGNGGAIFNAGTTELNNSNLSKNLAIASTNANPRRGMGGALFNGAQDADDAPLLTVNGGAITNGTGNFLSTTGGGIANSEAILGGPTPVLNVNGTNITGAYALLGGAFYNGGTATFTGGTISGSLAGQGGAGWLNPIVTTTAKPSTTIDGTVLSGNVAAGGAALNGGNGGALFNTGALTIKGGAKLTGNQVTKSTNTSSSVTGWGGSIYSGPLAATDSPSVTVDGATFTGGSPSGGNAIVGGAIASVGNLLGTTGTPSALALNNATFTGNTASVAGAVYASGVTSVTGSGFTTNVATDASNGYGGAIVSQSIIAADPAPSLTIDGSAIGTNTAAAGGGGVAALTGTLVIRNGSSLDGNTAASGGGLATAVPTTITASEVNGNNAGFQGGGIYSAAPGSGLVLTDTKVDQNTAANVGGGITSLGSLTVTGGEVNGNSALAGGGAYVLDGTTASFDGTSISGNTATALGGAGVASGGTLTLRNATLDGNHATHTTGQTGVGGAIVSGSTAENVNTKLTIDSSTISNNDAFAGSAIVAASTKASSTNVTSISNSTIDGNTNTSNIGAIEQFHALSITGSTLTRNTSVGGAGALSMFAPTSVSVSGSILTGNGASACSGHVVDGGYNMIDPTDGSCGPTAAQHDVVGPDGLGPLAGNGGPTLTRLPGITSPAIDQIPATTGTGTNDAVTGSAITLCASGAKDQRGVLRSAGGAKCDIGAVEVAQVAPTAITGPNPIDLSVGVGVGTPGPTFTTTAGYSPQVTMTVTGLPAGVSFHDNGDGTVSLTGTPAAGSGGSYNVTVKASNEAGSVTFDTVVRVHQAPALTGPASDTYTVGQLGGPDTFSMQSGFPPATLSTTSTLPNGVTFTDNGNGTATITGTPLAGSGGVYTIVIKGSNGTLPDATFIFTLTVQEGPTITGFGSDTAIVGTAYSSPTITTTGQPAATVTADGLPAGLSIQQANGSSTAKIVGTPANGQGGEYDITLHAHNVVGDAQTTVHLTVKEAPELTGPTTARIVAGFAGTVTYSADGFPVATITRTGALPAGMTFTDNGNGTATISGTPAVSAVGTYPITITASNGVNPDAVVHLSLEIAPPLSISTTTLPHAQFGSAYNENVTAVGGQPAYTFALAGGSLPAGLTLTPSGAITGVPTGTPGTTSTFTVKVTDSANPAQTATKQLSITLDKGVTQLAVSPILLKTQSTGLLGVQITLGVVQAKLTGGNPAQPIAGQPIIFTVNGTPVCSGTTGPTGDVICTMSLANTLIATLSGTITASYAGNATWLPSSGSNGLIST